MDMQKSVRVLAEELRREGHAVSHQTVAELLHEMDYSLQAKTRKSWKRSQHADRNRQFEYINRKAQRYLKQGEPVISVDTKKKELVGDFRNPGREWQPQGQPEQVRVHDFEIRRPENGKVAPYGVYDLGRNTGWVSVGVDHDTAEFAVESIRRWWRWMGSRSYPKATRLLITAQAGRQQWHPCGYGNGNCNNSPMKSDWKSRSVTSRRAPASGTK